MTATNEIPGPLLMTPEEFAHLHGIGLTTARKCIAGKSKTYPPLRAKRVGKRYYVTAEAAAAWRARLKDA